MKPYVVAAALVLLASAACGDRPPEAGPGQATPIATPSGRTPSPQETPPQETPSREPPPPEAPSPRDRALVRDFLAFATEPSSETAAHVPFAPEVRIGLASRLLRTVDADALGDAKAWVLEQEHFRAYIGPFSALESIQHHSDRRRDFEVSVGPHPHCVSPPVPPPAGFGKLRRVSVQPSGSQIDSCLFWFTVDLFVDASGAVRAVTLDVWEP